MEVIQSAYSQGNDAYRLHQYDRAVECYSTAIDAIHRLPQRDIESTDLLRRCLSNRSQCYLQLRDYMNALNDCNTILQSNPTELKALQRRAIAYENCNQYQQALQDIQRIGDIDLSLWQGTTSWSRQLIAMAVRLEKAIAEDQSVCKREGIPISLVTTQQSLRLNIQYGLEAKTSLLYNQSHRIQLYIGNEFNLWNRSFFNPLIHYDLSLLCSIEYSASNDGNQINPVDFSFSCSKMNETGKFQVNLTVNDTSDIQSPRVCIFKFSLNDRFLGNEIIPVLSLPITILPANSLQEDCNLSTLSQLAIQVEANSIKDVMIDNQHIYSFEAPFSLGIGGKVWDSSYILLDYLHREGRHFIEGKKVLEVGCGTGLAGLALASLRPSRMYLTDLPEVVPLIAGNIALNSALCADWKLKLVYDTCYHPQSCSWGEELSVTHQECEIIIASDVVYDPIGYEPLAITLQQFLSMDDRVCIMAHRKRHPENDKFFDMLLERGLQLTAIPFASSLVTAASNGALSDVKLFQITLRALQ